MYGDVNKSKKYQFVVFFCQRTFIPNLHLYFFAGFLVFVAVVVGFFLMTLPAPFVGFDFFLMALLSVKKASVLNLLRT